MSPSFRSTGALGALLFLAAALAPPPTADAQQLTAALPESLTVGETARVKLQAIDAIGRPAPGARVILACNDTAIVWPSRDRLTGRRAGETVCRAAWDRVDGARQEILRTIRVVATAPAAERFAGAAELPRATVDVRAPAITGTTRVVHTAAELHTALGAAQCGDQVVVHPARYVGSFALRTRCATGGIVLRAAGPIPKGPGMRVVPGDSTWMPTLASAGANAPTLRTEGAACGWHLEGLYIASQPGATVGALVSIAGHQARSLAEMPCRITLARTLVLGRPDQDLRRCVLGNGAAIAVVDSWLGECHSREADAQAFLAWTGPGPLLLENNTLEGSGEIVLLGGADPQLVGMLPRDVTIRRNHFTRPRAWNRATNPTGWLVKNLLELKLGQRVLIEGNVFEHNWADAQTGFALLFKSVNQAGGAPWSETSDVVVRYNIIRATPSAVNLAAKPESHPAVPASRFTFAHNTFTELGPGSWPNGKLFHLQGVAGLTIDHNTGGGLHTGLYLTEPGQRDLTVTNNHFTHATAYGVLFGTGGSGTAILEKMAPGWTFRGNAMVGVAATTYPPGNTVLAFGAAPPAGVGADLAELARRTAGVIVSP